MENTLETPEIPCYIELNQADGRFESTELNKAS